MRFRDRIAGEIVEDASGYTFTYDPAYLADQSTPSVSMTLPKRIEPYRSPHLFSFFFGLLAEGIQKEIQCRYLKIDEEDDFGRLLATSKNDCVGAVYVTA
ncbi:MAG: HipA N-terminal domain-containing protein [Kiritimatiellae bacterium]|nr:HipA N-terminal domain-containing protein [Kiritimatiellia bacterium]